MPRRNLPPRKFMITLEYDGSQFSGWQVQPNSRTVQGEVEKALAKIFKSPIRLFGSGRTDAGVHALGQVAHFSAKTNMPTKELIRALNGNLPDDVSVLAAAEASPAFHAQRSAKSKTYRYSILNRQERSAMDRGRVWHIPYRVNLAALKREAKLFLGTHDFRSFTATDSSTIEKNTRRKITAISIKKKGPRITIDISANGFLYKMVRNIVGTLIEVGTGRAPEGSVKSILKARSRVAAGETAPAHGLTLLKVRYGR